MLYRGKPLEFGSVLFQPDAGPPARGVIKLDGTFQLSTHGLDDGAVIGRHRVRIACFESQQANAPARAESGLGRSMIPSKYCNLTSSGLHVEVKVKNEPFVFELSD